MFATENIRGKFIEADIFPRTCLIRLQNFTEQNTINIIETEKIYNFRKVVYSQSEPLLAKETL